MPGTTAAGPSPGPKTLTPSSPGPPLRPTTRHKRRQIRSPRKTSLQETLCRVCGKGKECTSLHRVGHPVAQLVDEDAHVFGVVHRHGDQVAAASREGLLQCGC